MSMQIRTITVGAREEDLGRAAAAARAARERLAAAGYQVQTLRLALAAGGANRCGDFASIARGVEEQAIDAGFDCVSLGPLAGDRLAALPEALAATDMAFAAAHLTGPDGTVYPDMLRGAAEAIVAIGAATPGGMGNMRFAALAGVGPGSPFFPAAYHDGGAPWIAIGPEAAALAVQAATELRMKNEECRKGDDPASFFILHSSFFILTELIEQHDAQIEAALEGLQAETGVPFAGCDWSLAPYPDETRSVGAAIEALSGMPFGAWGTLAAVRGLTAAIRAARVMQLGFSGVMLPVIEDPVLARRNAEGRYTLRDLLAFSAVCGTGLDTIPLPGDTTAEQVAGVLAEVAALSSALGKPLTARLLPMPGLRAGNMTTFGVSSDPQIAQYFVDTRVMGM
jgi:uncharacterized protein (UPF0210 family)